MATGTLSAAGDVVTLTGVAGQGALTCTLYGTHAGAVVQFETTTGGVAPVTVVNTVSGGSDSQWLLGTNSSNVFAFGLGAPEGATFRVRLISITSGSVTVNLTSSPPTTYQAITQQLTVTPDLSLGNFAVISIVGVTNITITTPVGGVTGNNLDLIVQNGHTTTMGTIAWGGVYVLAGAFTAPATGKSRTISFRNTGTSWVEFSRAGADMTF